MASNATGIDTQPHTTNPTEDPFAAQRDANNDPFNNDLSGIAGPDEMRSNSMGSPTQDRRMSKEWDASKVPPSQFQKRKGSIFATQSGRDGKTSGKDRDKAYFEKLKEKGWLPSKK